ncbi:energy transducer TonB [Caulobacter sp. 1776]|uniref:energy transducer TonB family protein n=1 Tax=Caulobacter sp. 1776 TaxID=3156420 RepID=UPI0033978C25
MRGLLLLALAFLTPVAAQADRIAQPPAAKARQAQLLTIAPIPTTFACGKGQARLIEGAPLPPRVQQSWAPVQAAAASPVPERYAFGVDADGRVVDLKREGAWTPDSQAAVLASWRFAPGAPAQDCKLPLVATVTPLEAASPAQLMQAMIAEGRAAPPELRKALDALGDCTRMPRRRPQTVSYPDLRAFGDRTVDPAWAGVTYDVDAEGAVRNVAIVTRHGEPAFADTAAASVAESRFQSGSPRRGCHAVFRARPKASPATAHPKDSAFERPGDACALNEKELVLPESKPYPPAYAARRVGGWAIVRFDVAPWGQIGPVEVLASQPTPAFGVAAVELMQGVRPKAPASGYRGCVMPIVYAIPAIPEDEY